MNLPSKSIACYVFLLSLLLAAAPASAKKTHLLLETLKPGTSAIGGLTVDQATGDLLVIENKKGVISRWHSDGTPSNFAALGTNVIDGKGTGQCPVVAADCDQVPNNGLSFESGSQQIAVDNSGTVTDEDIYVTQNRPEGTHAVLVFSAEGEYLGQVNGAASTQFNGASAPCGVATDGNGNLFVGGNGEEKIYKYDPTSNPPTNADVIATFSSVSFPCDLIAGAGPSAGSLFVVGGGLSLSKIDSASGVFRYLVDPIGDRYIGIDASTGHLYSYNDQNQIFNKEVWEFDVSGAAGPVKISAIKSSVSASALAVQSSSGRIYVGYTLQGSTFGTGQIQVYGPLVTVPDVVASGVTTTSNTSATLNGTINPDGVAIEECYFEYGLTKSYGQTAPCVEAPVEIGTGTSPVAVHADVEGLTPESIYHVRLVARNVNDTVRSTDQTFRSPSKPEIVEQWTAEARPTEAVLKAVINPGNSPTAYRVEWGADTSYGQSTPEALVGSDDSEHTVSSTLEDLAPGATYHWRVVVTNGIGEDEGEDRSFRTYGEGAFALPDDRAYEMVSPLAKNGGEVAVPGPAGGAAEGTVEPQQASPAGDAVTYGSYTAFGDPESAPATSQYLSVRGPDGWSTDNINPRFEEGFLRDPFVGFSNDLSHAAVIAIEPELTEDAAIDVPNIYQRDNGTGELTALTTEAKKADFSGCLSYGGTSADSKVVIFAAGPKLFEWNAAEGSRLVSVLPDESPATAIARFGAGGSFGGDGCDMTSARLRNAISADGTRVFWTYSGTFSGAPSPLFARVNGESTIQLDAPNVGISGKGGEGRYQGASLDGSKVFFLSNKKLTAAPKAPGATDLYLYDFSEEAGERVRDLTPLVGEAAEVQRVLGISENGSLVYFVAKGALAEGAVAEQPNLYVWSSEEGVRYLATADVTEGRVSGDGSHFAFVAREDLTDFDNAIPGGCEPKDEGGMFGDPRCDEIFLYDFGADSLVCASCNSAGTRPLGAAIAPQPSQPYEQPRYVSADGSRVLFESHDSLDPHDVNGKLDVYEFETAGTGSCTNQSPTFSPDSDGCLLLISTGSSEDDSYFIDASSSADDVFISTREGLVFNDDDGRFDVYDARVGGSSPVPPPPGCEGEGCRSAGTSPPAVPAPATASFEGPGDPTPKRGCPKGRRQVKKGNRTSCVRKARKHKKHKKHRKHRAKGKRRATR